MNDHGNPLTDPHVRDSRFAISRAISKPASVTLMLAALDILYLFLGLGRSNVRCEDLPQEAPRALEPEEQRRFMRVVERCTFIRDRAIASLLFYTGLAFYVGLFGTLSCYRFSLDAFHSRK